MNAPNASQSPLVLTVLGPDRPGLVDLLATTIREHGGNWRESRMAHLGGQFAGILRLTAPADRALQLTEALQNLEKQGIRVLFHTAALLPDGPSDRIASLELVGQDRPGIVQQLSSALARHQVNVEELETGCESAPMTGESLFHARVRVRLPDPCDLDQLRLELERIASDLMVDLTFQPAANPG